MSEGGFTKEAVDYNGWPQECIGLRGSGEDLPRGYTDIQFVKTEIVKEAVGGFGASTGPQPINLMAYFNCTLKDGKTKVIECYMPPTAQYKLFAVNDKRDRISVFYALPGDARYEAPANPGK